ncbi:protein of unknown function [Limnospira indica PCC 8005]|uniref:Uncharacterized protein n=1 Tax=Limnospira indica PCC 8005 TaxID=376219 RepID=A0A9P1KKG9_9CYAN|nr:protein of unknown function [Limnospira indica PCC 8005]
MSLTQVKTVSRLSPLTQFTPDLNIQPLALGGDDVFLKKSLTWSENIVKIC